MVQRSGMSVSTAISMPWSLKLAAQKQTKTIVINKPRNTCYALGRVWWSNAISEILKLRIFYYARVVSALLYCCKTLGKNLESPATFVNKCLRRMIKIFWPRSIANLELRRLANSRQPLAKEVVRRWWRLIGRYANAQQVNANQVLVWNPRVKDQDGQVTLGAEQ